MVEVVATGRMEEGGHAEEGTGSVEERERDRREGRMEWYLSGPGCL